MSQSLAVKTGRTQASSTNFLEWCETHLESALADDAVLTHQFCWEKEKDRTLCLCLAFHGSNYLPSSLDTFNRMCAASPDVVDALEKGQVITDAVIEEALFSPDSVRDRMPLEIRESCDRYRNHILEAAQSWEWVFGIYEEHEAKHEMQRRCSCRFRGGCVCD